MEKSFFADSHHALSLLPTVSRYPLFYALCYLLILKVILILKNEQLHLLLQQFIQAVRLSSIFLAIWAIIFGYRLDLDCFFDLAIFLLGNYDIVLLEIAKDILFACHFTLEIKVKCCYLLRSPQIFADIVFTDPWIANYGHKF